MMVSVHHIEGRSARLKRDCSVIIHHIEGSVKSLDVHLSEKDLVYLEEPYMPHNLSGVMAVNKPVMNGNPYGSLQKEINKRHKTK